MLKDDSNCCVTLMCLLTSVTAHYKRDDTLTD